MWCEFIIYSNFAPIFYTMGIVVKQSIKGTIWTYLGVIIGFISASYIYPNFLSTDQIGLIGLLVSYVQLLGMVFLLGLPGVTNRLFPYFRDAKNGHNGFLKIALVFHLVGALLLILLYFLFKPSIINNNLESSPLFVQYLYLLVPMTIAMMAFNFFDNYTKVLYNASIGIFMQEFLQKALILVITILFALDLVNFQTYMNVYAIAFSVKTIIIFIHLLRNNEIKTAPLEPVLTPWMKKEILTVALFNFVGGLGAMIIFKFDKIIINHLTDLSNTGVYTIAFYFGSIISKPATPINKIASTIIADAWKSNNVEQIRSIYYKSCINQLIIGGFLFLGVVVNLDNIIILLGEDFAEAKWVIFFIGLGYLINMSTGASGETIGLSKYYRYNLIFLGILIISTISLMFLLIPVWGIVGAAVSIAGAFLLNNLIRFTFLKMKFGLQPFSYQNLLITIFYIAIYFLVYLIPTFPFIYDLLLRSIIVVLTTAVFLYFIPISDDIWAIRNTILQKILAYLRK